MTKEEIDDLVVELTAEGFTPRLGWKTVKPNMESLARWAEGTVKYRQYAWAYPRPGWGPLAVFSSHCRAVRGAGMVWSYQNRVFRCLYLQSNALGVWTSDKYARNRPDGGIGTSLDVMPHNTDLADAVMLLEEVK